MSSPEGAAGGIAYNGGLYSYWTDFIFQGMFAATAVTIVSGAVAERIKFSAYIAFAVLYCVVGYPVIGSWGWGGGWLKELGFYDLAGSTFVHSVGGWAALVGAFLLGPRIGKFVNGRAHAIPGSNLGFATLGVFLLWFGWVRFNGASVFSADPIMVAYVFTTTALSAAFGIIAAMLTSWFAQKKPDLSMILNGCLAGLVGITAGADCVRLLRVHNRAVSGVAVVFSVYFFDRIKIDDPVGALSGAPCMRRLGNACGGRILARPRIRPAAHRRGRGGSRERSHKFDNIPRPQAYHRNQGVAPRRTQGLGHLRTRHGGLQRIPNLLE